VKNVDKNEHHGVTVYETRISSSIRIRKVHQRNTTLRKKRDLGMYPVLCVNKMFYCQMSSISNCQSGTESNIVVFTKFGIEKNFSCNGSVYAMSGDVFDYFVVCSTSRVVCVSELFNKFHQQCMSHCTRLHHCEWWKQVIIKTAGADTGGDRGDYSHPWERKNILQRISRLRLHC